MTIKVRFAAPDDAEIVYKFIMDLATYERDPEAVEVTPKILAKQMELHKPPFECLIAEENSEPVGFALFYHNYSTWIGKMGIYVEDIFVPPSLRRRGIGLKLMEELAEISRARDCGRIEWNVLNWNEPAKGFYRSFGAIPLEDWTIFRMEVKTLID